MKEPYVYPILFESAERAVNIPKASKQLKDNSVG